MVKVVLVAFFVAYVAGATFAQNCSAKIATFRQCMKDSHKKMAEQRKTKFEGMKSQMDACYTKNGCTPPTGPRGPQEGDKDDNSGAASGDNQQSTRGACRKAVHQEMKSRVETCMKKELPGMTLPPHDDDEHKGGFGGGHGRGGFGRRGGRREGQDNCANRKAVHECKRALMNSSRPSEQEQQQMFQARCQAKKQCQSGLGSDCQAQLEKIKQAACKCFQQEMKDADTIRSGIPACSGQSQNGQAKQGRGPSGGQHKCGQKDYCDSPNGYQQFKQDHKDKQERKGGHGQRDDNKS